MRILITNDDGIFAPGIDALVKWACTLGEVTVVAPKVEQSGKSHSIEFVKPVEIREVSLWDGVRAYSMDSTPADCVRFGIAGLGETYDLVLSGINRGVNLGADLVYSGTVAAIFEAGRLGHRALALSTYPTTLREASAELSRVWQFIEKNELFSKNPLYNVNIPADPKGLRITRQGSPYFSDVFELVSENMYLQTGCLIPDVSPDDETLDTVMTEKGYITLTPMLTTRTNLSVFEDLKFLNK